MASGRQLPTLASDKPAGASVSRRSEGPFGSCEIVHVDERGDTALHIAARDADIANIRSLIATATKNNYNLTWLLQRVNNEGFTPLHYMVPHCRKGGGQEWESVLSKLLLTGDYAHVVDAAGDTLLHLAATAKNLYAVEALVDANIIVGKFGELPLNARGMTALDIAVDSSATAIVFEILRLRPSVASAERLVRLPDFLNELFRKVWDMYSSNTVKAYGDYPELLGRLLYDLTFPNGNSCSAISWINGPRWKRDSLLYLARAPEFDVNKVYGSSGQTALHIATVEDYRDVVRIILEDRNADLVDANREDLDGNSPLQFAMEEGLAEIEFLLMKRSEVKENVERLYRDRQVYVDAANAILVGAALIASVTFAGWLQPPLGYGGGGGQYAAVEGHPGVSNFWVFNSLSFFFAIATVVAGAGRVLPNPNVYIAKAVRSLRWALSLAAFLLVLSIAFVLGAFASAGFAVLPPGSRWDSSMIVTAAIGGVVNFVLAWWFLVKLYSLRPGSAKRRRRKIMLRALRSENWEEIERQFHLEGRRLWRAKMEGCRLWPAWQRLSRLCS